MHQDKKSKHDLEKLRKILDNPTDPEIKKMISPEEKHLDSVRRRLTTEPSKPAVPYIAPSKKGKPTRPLAPTITVYKKIEPQPLPEKKPVERKEEPLPEFTEILPPAEDLFADEDLYEIEKIEQSPPKSFETKLSDQQLQEVPSFTPVLEKEKEQPTRINEQLPEWEPVNEQETHSVPSEQPPPFQEISPPHQPLTLEPPKEEIPQEPSLPPVDTQKEKEAQKLAKKLQRQQKQEEKKAKKLAAKQLKFSAREQKKYIKLEAQRKKEEEKKARQQQKEKEQILSPTLPLKPSKQKPPEKEAVFQEYQPEEPLPEEPSLTVPRDKEKEKEAQKREQEKRRDEKKEQKRAAKQAELDARQQKQQAALEARRRVEDVKKARQKSKEKEQKITPSLPLEPLQEETVFEEFRREAPIAEEPSTPTPSDNKKEKESQKREQEQRQAQKKAQKLAIKEARRAAREKKQQEKEALRKQTEQQRKTQRERAIKESMRLPPINPKQLQHAREIFQGLESIDEKTAILLYNHGYFSLDDLRKATIDDLTIIRGIKRKHAKQIKKELERKHPLAKQPATPTAKNQPPVKHEEDVTEWKAYHVDEIPLIESIPNVCTHGAYTLYKRDVVRVGGKKTTIHFFSKERPTLGEPALLPQGYRIAINRKTGIPYLKKKR